MTKAQLVQKISERLNGMTRRQTETIVTALFDSIRESLARGEKIEVRGFGSFRLRQRKMREGRNPKTGMAVHVPAKRVPFFKAGKELKELIDT